MKKKSIYITILSVHVLLLGWVLLITDIIKNDWTLFIWVIDIIGIFCCIGFANEIRQGKKKTLRWLNKMSLIFILLFSCMVIISTIRNHMLMINKELMIAGYLLSMFVYMNIPKVKEQFE